eukprot:CAMPEP_0117471942 /NCGR_PEP_ID=MMETSP0784-20121206/7989_1 /TAXON_ID=39447 /ORGANISM="" /LENGTH=373 /DNA_ID=CAMNT_0005266073 /DNA_START=48 /DNA_END=1169 /DNA_ORIENTATION=+
MAICSLFPRAAPALRSTGPRVCHAVNAAPQLQFHRPFATYAADPGRWQADPCVQMYGQLLAVRDAQPGAFLVAAETLRAQPNLPKDLRASASRTRASVLFRQAAKLATPLNLGADSPWPKHEFVEALSAVSLACDAYDEALAESSEPALCREVAPHCPEWPEALVATKAAQLQAQKLRAELRFRQALWHGRQAERSRAIVEVERLGTSAVEAAERAGAALKAVGLADASEQSLWVEAASAAETLNEELVGVLSHVADEHASATSRKELAALLSRGQALHMVLLKDLAVACAMSGRLEQAVGHMLAALRLRVQDPQALEDVAAEQVRAAAKGVLELCSRELGVAETRREANSVCSQGGEIAEAIAAFDAWRDGR